LIKSREVWPEGHHNLDIIAGYCGYDLTNHHQALADAEACAWIAREIL
jgi:DNA polymerase-3 subunit epsilon